MKLTKSKLKQLIEEEVSNVVVPGSGGGADPIVEQVKALIEAIEAAGPQSPSNEMDWETLMGTYPELLRAIFKSGFRVAQLIPWDAQ